MADNLVQAVEDLTREWSRERRVRWAIDTGTPAPGLTEDRPRPTVTPDETMRLARLRAERAAVAAAIPPDPRPFLAASSTASPSSAKPNETFSRVRTTTRAAPKAKPPAP